MKAYEHFVNNFFIAAAVVSVMSSNPNLNFFYIAAMAIIMTIVIKLMGYMMIFDGRYHV